ncbi:hypothetical protein LOTGIDRAFT_163684 [Lottia gigantea]|uniref:C-type lectin domain-containing protein n=1 Tax=Lottia gigantea TaxID=225164 RepID=V4BP99_LOTGI|nr:hypothetical protein LOTGIDRAFT_163684 [Lottia gigantea]ESO90799.1 hypothetical protein LOTGIDRAFT_163684 [Lottia gigantea]
MEEDKTDNNDNDNDDNDVINDEQNNNDTPNCVRGFKQFDNVCLKTYHYATDYETADRKCRNQGSHLIRGTKKTLEKMLKNMKNKKMIENTKYWTSSYDLDENSIWFHRFDPKDFAMVMSIDGKDIEERVESRSMRYKFICERHSKSKPKELEVKESFQKEKGSIEQEHSLEEADIVIEILSEGEIVNELGLINDEPSELTDSQQSSEASDLSSQQSSEESDLSSEASDLSSQQSSDASDLSSQQSSEESKINSEQEQEDLEKEPENRLSEEQWGEQTPDELGAAEYLKDQQVKEHGHEQLISEDHRTKEHEENSSPTTMTAASFLLPLAYILLCILN